MFKSNVSITKLPYIVPTSLYDGYTNLQNTTLQQHVVQVLDNGFITFNIYITIIQPLYKDQVSGG